MKMNRFIAGGACALALAIAAPAHAQGSQSDAMTPGTGGSDVVGGLFGPLSGPTGANVAASPAVTQLINAVANNIQTQLGSGVLVTPSGVTISPRVQTMLLTALGPVASPTVMAQLTTALGGTPAAAQLVQAIQGLLGTSTVAMAALDEALDNPALAASIRDRTMAAPDPVQLVEAREQFNAFVMASDRDFLLNPPEEFLAIHATLFELIEAANSAQ